MLLCGMYFTNSRTILQNEFLYNDKVSSSSVLLPAEWYKCSAAEFR